MFQKTGTKKILRGGGTGQCDREETMSRKKMVGMRRMRRKRLRRLRSRKNKIRVVAVGRGADRTRVVLIKQCRTKKT